MLADTAVAVNPDDERYEHLVGRPAILPLVGRELPIIADDYVKPEFGTGALKITPGPRPQRLRDRPPPRPARDHRHRRGRPHDRRGGRALRRARPCRRRSERGRRRRCASEGRLVRVSPTTHEVPFSHRSGERVEPLISLQWFMRHGRAGAAGDRRREGRPREDPPRALDAASTSTGWRTSAPGASRASCGGATGCRSGTAATRPTSATTPPRGRRLGRSDPDVLDTWFSSRAVAVRDAGLARRDARAAGLLPDRRALHGARHPLPLGRAHDHDGARVRRRRPVRRRLHPLGHPGARRPAHERSRSAPASTRSTRSTKHGADGVRFGLLAMSSSQDVRYSAEKVAAGRAAGEQAVERVAADPARASTRTRAPRRGRARSRTAGSSRASQPRARRSTRRIDEFDFSHAALGLYDFVYGELCDWYLELVKPRLYEPRGRSAPTSTRRCCTCSPRRSSSRTR